MFLLPNKKALEKERIKQLGKCCTVKSQDLLRVGFFYRCLKAKSRIIKKVSARNHQAVANQTGKHSFAGNRELVGYKGWEKEQCKSAKNVSKGEEQISPKKSHECKEANSHK